MKTLSVQGTLAVLCILNACHFSRLKSKEPHFKLQRQAVTDSIKRLYACDEIKISSMFRLEKMSVPDSVLRITLIRHEAPSETEAQLEDMAEKIATLSCNSMQSRFAYNLYEVEYKWASKDERLNSTTVIHSFLEKDLPNTP